MPSSSSAFSPSSASGSPGRVIQLDEEMALTDSEKRVNLVDQLVPLRLVNDVEVCSMKGSEVGDTHDIW